MEQRLIRARCGVLLMAVLLILFTPLSNSCKEKQEGIMTEKTQAAGQEPPAADESQRLARQIQKLTEIPLPDEWYSATGASPTEHFESVARAMRAKNPNAPTARDLIARYENGGRPFMHSVWFNHPILCKKCGQAGADGSYTVISVHHDLTVTISASEMHEVISHQGSFSKDKLEALKRILLPISRP